MPSYRTVHVVKHSTDFRAATEIVEVPELPTASAGHVVVKNHYVGVNATDINVTNGHYGASQLPHGCGFEAVGEIISVGEGVENFAVGDAVAYQKMLGAFTEYAEAEVSYLIKLPSPEPWALPLMICGVSASIALYETGQMKSNETVLVTSAAGGTGLIAVQLAKLAGNHVIGTCSSDEKVQVLKDLGCDRVINYTKESIREVLETEYPNGIDLVFETVGGETMEAAIRNIAIHGRVIAFGHISAYKSGGADRLPVPGGVLGPRSASIRGFFLANHVAQAPEHIRRLVGLIQEGKLKPAVDPTPFHGLEGIADAIDYMYARKNIGKLVIKLV
ncbi:hypothetical protein Poli38472_003865 [Pythium oligandrum]|uniref:Enoyl reductase (ER) domain-containing protein n=1 Tax=Pythium oligandrum TaxID=41045 RepID=A0A8K1CMM4_PYTOL|nr:hypothetical protein Poli38472_003865 [Pythium oligandrum]|eukprot:TMW66100.1 hypothetical protein Poli38472_003865 [Pythium oligandrum]